MLKAPWAGGCAGRWRVCGGTEGYQSGVQRISQSKNYQCATLIARGKSGFDERADLN